MRLQRLIKHSKNFEEVLERVQKFPRWYLETEEQKKLTKATLKELYEQRKSAILNNV